MELIDIDGLRCESVSTLSAELIIVPDIVFRIVDDRSVVRSRLEMSGKRITLLLNAVILAYDSVFIAVPLLCARNLLFPYSCLAEHEHLAIIGIPVVEIAHDSDHSRVGCPDSENESLPVLILVRVSPEELVAHVVLALVEQISSIHICALCLPCGCSPAVCR